MRAPLFGVLFLAGALSAGEAVGETPVAPSRIAASIGGTDFETSTLIGTSGQIYAPTGDGGWKRTGRGGVACRVGAAYQIGTTLWAVCSRAPIFRRADNVWFSEPLNNRGRTRASPISAKPLISVGRHLYGIKGGAWARLSSAPGRITSLLASSSRSGLAVTTRRELLRISGTSWKVVIPAIKRPKKTDDRPLSLFGSAKNAYLRFDSGAIVHVGTSKRKAVAWPQGTKSVTVDASCAEKTGTVLALARAETSSGTNLVLWRLSGTSVSPAGDAPSLGDKEFGVALHCRGDQALLSTSKGRVLLRDAAGTWTEKKIVTTPPPETKKTSPGARPAETR